MVGTLTGLRDGAVRPLAGLFRDTVATYDVSDEDSSGALTRAGGGPNRPV